MSLYTMVAGSISSRVTNSILTNSVIGGAITVPLVINAKKSRVDETQTDPSSDTPESSNHGSTVLIAGIVSLFAMVMMSGMMSIMALM